MKKWFNLSIILKIYLTVLPVFFIFRLILLFFQLERIDSVQHEFFNILESFILGIRFDIVISSYILLLPALVLSLEFIFKKTYTWLNNFLFYWVFILFSLAFIVCAADIPYFNQFFSRFSITAFQWIDSPLWMLKLIFQEPRYFIIIFPLGILIFFFYRLLKEITRLSTGEESYPHPSLRIIVSLIFLGLIFIGIRGRLQEKSPIKVGTAYFCDNAFLNQLGLNPVFTLMRSYFDSLDERNRTTPLMDDKLAIQNVRKYLKIDKPINNFEVSRQVLSDSTGEKRYNVILVIMESMSAAKMERHGNKKHLTPFLDSLSHHCYYFENIYTAGIHTFNGIFATLFSFPAVYHHNPMKESTMFRFNGIGHTLRKNGYSTTYFTTHDGQFDNVEGYLRANDFENIISLDDYPSGIAKTPRGVPDDFMFEFSMPVIDRLYEQKKPFFVTFITASDHKPYYLPDYFKPKSQHIPDQMVEFADWSLKKLVTLASGKDWFDSTVFVFVADHGAAINVTYDIPINYHHTPLLIYAPGILKEARTFDCIGGQIDVFPTIMGILNQSYINNTLGIDLLSESRPFIFISHEDKLGVINRDYFLIMENENGEALYRYREPGTKNYKDEYPQLVREMEEYTISNLQVFQILMYSETRYIE
jgi:phosphoglycerol transferase MdoB-like AlkP superfamily enzyme